MHLRVSGWFHTENHFCHFSAAPGLLFSAILTKSSPIPHLMLDDIVAFERAFEIYFSCWITIISRLGIASQKMGKFLLYDTVLTTSYYELHTARRRNPGWWRLSLKTVLGLPSSHYNMALQITIWKKSFIKLRKSSLLKVAAKRDPMKKTVWKPRRSLHPALCTRSPSAKAVR